MKVEIQNERVVIGEESLRFYGYYFDPTTTQGDPSGLTTMKNLRAQWAKALEVLDDKDAAFLPYNLEDEWVECLKATRNGERIKLSCVNVAANGWSLALDDVQESMLEPQTLVEDDSDRPIFGEYNRQEIIESLRDAQIGSA
jgi:hypothetical protein